MLAELAHLALAIALVVSLVLAVLPIAGAGRSRLAWMALARPAAQAQFVFVAIAFGTLVLSFARSDFSLVNVANHSNTGLPLAMVARVLGVMGIVAAGILLFVLTVSNPFDPMLRPALEGRDLNPRLQDPGRVFHPPPPYMGYVGFAVADRRYRVASWRGAADAAAALGGVEA